MSKKSIILLSVVAAVAAIAIVGVTVFVGYTRGYDGESEQWVYVGSNASPDDVSRELKQRLGDTGAKVDKIMRLSGKEAVNGAYLIEPGMSAIDIARKISRGAQTPIKLTFNNIRTLDQLASRVGERLELDSLQFMKACDEVLPGAGFTKPTYIAAFLPDTYEFYWTASPESVVKRLLDYRNRFWNDERRAKAKSLGLTPVQAATVASIAEEETNNAEERGVVARLYMNRLNRGMLLQADPTVKYAVGDFGLRRITGAHLAVASPYNTYKNPGLPPGPIRMPSARTLDALLKSKPHNYIYMCAKEDFSGLHNFASDFATHQKNAARYRKELDRRKIR